MTALDLVRVDLANLRRDPMLLAAGIAPVLVAGLLAVGFDPLVAAAADLADLAAHRALFVAGALLLTPLLIGFVVGFLLVEEREERILEAVAVTPRGRDGFLLHRLTLPAAIGAGAAGVVGGTVGSLSPGALAAVVVLAGASATLVTMTMAAFARDRVQGLAISKLTGFLLVAAVGFQFVDGWWRLPLALVPATWVVDVAVRETVGPPFLLGVLTHGGVGFLLWRRLRRSSDF